MGKHHLELALIHLYSQGLGEHDAHAPAETPDERCNLCRDRLDRRTGSHSKTADRLVGNPMNSR